MSLSVVTLSDRPDLLTTVATWVYEKWWRHLPEHSPETLADILSERRASDHIYESFVALLDSVPVGTAAVLDHAIDTERRPDLTPWLAAVYVIPEARRQKIGEQLVSRATAFGDQRALRLCTFGLLIKNTGTNGSTESSWNNLKRTALW